MKKKKKSKARILWITDPWTTLDHPKDTTLRLVEAALAQGISCFWSSVKSIRWTPEGVRLDVQTFKTVYPGRQAQSFQFNSPQAMVPTEFDQIHYRTDPPIDLAYLHPLQLLVLGGAEKKIVNPAHLLFGANEKLEAGYLGALMPPSIAASEWDSLHEFGQTQGKTVLKPLHEAQSKGVELLDWTTPESRRSSRSKLEAATLQFRQPVLLQKYLEGIVHGETRLWFLDGKLLSSVRKLPLQGDFRVNLDRGSRLAPAELSANDKKAATRIGKHLKARKIRLAAVDLIDGYVTDFNFTSPGLIPQMEALLGEDLATPIVRALVG